MMQNDHRKLSDQKNLDYIVNWQGESCPQTQHETLVTRNNLCYKITILKYVWIILTQTVDMFFLPPS
jgi:hypothetical protein